MIQTWSRVEMVKITNLQRDVVSVVWSEARCFLSGYISERASISQEARYCLGGQKTSYKACVSSHIHNMWCIAVMIQPGEFVMSSIRVDDCVCVCVCVFTMPTCLSMLKMRLLEPSSYSLDRTSFSTPKTTPSLQRIAMAVLHTHTHTQS